jgi:hypothetical protein
MKSHDFHVFMQTFILLTYCDLLPKVYGMHSQRLVISLEIYTSASC